MFHPINHPYGIHPDGNRLKVNNQPPQKAPSGATREICLDAFDFPQDRAQPLIITPMALPQGNQNARSASKMSEDAPPRPLNKKILLYNPHSLLIK
jgi:hypothetical protein